MSSHEASLDQHADDERHLPDGNPFGQNGLNRNDSPDEEMLRMLQECGLDPSTPVDPSSLRALQRLVCTPGTSHRKTAAMPEEDSKQPATPNSALDGLKEQESNSALQGVFGSPHVPSEVLRPIDFRRVTSDLTQGNALLQSASGMEEETDASTAGSTQGTASAEKLILDHLQLQTALLMDLQRRVDELSQIVMHQQHRPGFPPLHFQQPGTMPPPQFQQPRNAFPEDQRRPPAGEVGPPPPRPEMFVLTRLTRLYEAFVSIPSLVRSSRMTEICRVFWALHRRDMGNRLDGNLLLKIIFMGLVVTAKLTASNKRKKKGSSSSSLQFGLAIVLILVGFLLQTGYYRFFHDFFVKEKYPQRIWNGETINVAAQPPPRPAAAAAAQQNPQRAAAAPPQQGILRGGIARANPQVGVRRALTDVLYLFGTLILSILPMWKVEPLQPQDPQEEEEEEEGVDQRQQNEEQEGGGGGDGM